MRGLIYGDVCGSVYEWKPVQEHPQIQEPLRFTDDTVLGAAVADALLTCREQNITDDEGILHLLTKKLQEYGRRHPDAGYSRTFRAWLASDAPAPYGSKTNGAVMRCTSAGWLAHSPEEARRLGRLTAMPTHNHPEAEDAAALAAEIVYRFKTGESIEQVYALVQAHYQIPALAQIRPITEFDFTSKTTLPIAFAVFYETVAASKTTDGWTLLSEVAHSAISLGGDTDTNAAIAAAFAEAWLFSRGVFLAGHSCWAEIASLCTPDIVEVVNRMDAVLPSLRRCAE